MVSMQIDILLWINNIVNQYCFGSILCIVWINLAMNCCCVIFSVEKILFVSLSDSSRLHQIPLKSFLRYYHRNRQFYSLLPVWTTVWFCTSWSDAEISILPNWCCWSKNCKVVRLINWSNPSSQAARFGQTAEENTRKGAFKETGGELKGQNMGMIFGLTVY